MSALLQQCFVSTLRSLMPAGLGADGLMPALWRRWRAPAAPKLEKPALPGDCLTDLSILGSRADKVVAISSGVAAGISKTNRSTFDPDARSGSCCPKLICTLDLLHIQSSTADVNATPKLSQPGVFGSMPAASSSEVIIRAEGCGMPHRLGTSLAEMSLTTARSASGSGSEASHDAAAEAFAHGPHPDPVEAIQPLQRPERRRSCSHLWVLSAITSAAASIVLVGGAFNPDWLELRCPSNDDTLARGCQALCTEGVLLRLLRLMAVVGIAFLGGAGVSTVRELHLAVLMAA